MSYLKKFIGHLNTILTHKKWVYYYASKLGYPWLGLIHDTSKFSFEEFSESVKYWNGKRSPILEAKEHTGISYAWLHHKGRNKHHYEYWVDALDEGGIPRKMPFKYVIEMVCDWMAACRTYEKTGEKVFEKEYVWWCSRCNKVKMHNDTKKFIHKILWNLKENETIYPENVNLNIIREFLSTWEFEYNENDYGTEKL